MARPQQDRDHRERTAVLQRSEGLYRSPSCRHPGFCPWLSLSLPRQSRALFRRPIRRSALGPIKPLYSRNPYRRDRSSALPAPIQPPVRPQGRTGPTVRFPIRHPVRGVWSGAQSGGPVRGPSPGEAPAGDTQPGRQSARSPGLSGADAPLGRPRAAIANPTAQTRRPHPPYPPSCLHAPPPCGRNRPFPKDDHPGRPPRTDAAVAQW